MLESCCSVDYADLNEAFSRTALEKPHVVALHAHPASSSLPARATTSSLPLQTGSQWQLRYHTSTETPLHRGMSRADARARLVRQLIYLVKYFAWPQDRFATMC